MSYLAHYGTPRHSGRYPWGSGDNPYQHNAEFLKTVREMKDRGKSEKEIAEYMGMKTTEFRNKQSIYVNAEKVDRINRAIKLKEHGYSNVKIAEIMFDSPTKESTVRSLLNQGEKLKKDTCINTADMLAKKVELYRCWYWSRERNRNHKNEIRRISSDLKRGWI